MTERQKYHSLQALVCEIMPYHAPTTAIRAGYGAQYPAAASRLQNVKQGKVLSLVDLIAMVELTMPEYEIPEHLRPAAVSA